MTNMDYRGKRRIKYEDVLRAIGHYIDTHNFREVCILELEEGILVRGLVYTQNRESYQTSMEAYLFTNEDIDQVLDEAYRRRNQPQQPQKRGLFGK